MSQNLLVKADPVRLTVYYRDKAVATHSRTFDRHRRIELPQHVEEARRHKNHRRLSEEAATLMSLGEEAKSYIEHLAQTGAPLKKNLARLLALMQDYGSAALLDAIRRALAHRAYGADYIENILYQDMTPTRPQPPVRIENREALNRIWSGQSATHEEATSVMSQFDQQRQAAMQSLKQQTVEKPKPIVRSTQRVGRNDPCPCGSGKKYKKCCGQNS